MRVLPVILIPWAFTLSLSAQVPDTTHLVPPELLQALEA
jgi:hypothetical protein